LQGHKGSITTSTISKPETIIKLEALVSEYDWKVIQHADQIRMLVTNKLLNLSDNKDPKVQLKAVELLGKLADVGMFVEKQEITYKQRTDEEIDAALEEKLSLLIEGDFEEVKEPPKTVTKPVENASKGAMDIAPLPEVPKIDIGALLGE
jgi:PHP family Zn ribbon phosphoesterase